MSSIRNLRKYTYANEKSNENKSKFSKKCKNWIEEFKKKGDDVEKVKKIKERKSRKKLKRNKIKVTIKKYSTGEEHHSKNLFSSTVVHRQQNKKEAKNKKENQL